MAGLSYTSQQPVLLIGTRNTLTGATTGVALTAAYDTSKVFKVAGFSEFVLHAAYVTGAAETNNSIEIKLEESNDDKMYYQLTNESASGGVSTITSREFTYVGAAAATTYKFSYRIDISYKYLKVSVKESGVAANFGNVYVAGLLSGQ